MSDVTDAEILAAKAEGFDAAVASMRYQDGSPVEIVSVANPYRAASTWQEKYDREPQPEDGPEYHANHAYWLARHPEADDQRRGRQ